MIKLKILLVSLTQFLFFKVPTKQLLGDNKNDLPQRIGMSIGCHTGVTHDSSRNSFSTSFRHWFFNRRDVTSTRPRNILLVHGTICVYFYFWDMFLYSFLLIQLLCVYTVSIKMFKCYHMCKCIYLFYLSVVGWVLSHINLCRLFNTKSIFIQINSSTSNNSV